MQALLLSALLEKIDCHATITDDIAISGVNTLSHARSGEISFLANKSYLCQLAGSQATAVLVDEKTYQQHHESCRACLIVCRDPYLAFAKLQRYFYPQAKPHGSRHPSASVHPSAVVADDVDIAAGAVIGEGTVIASASMIGSGVVIGRNCRIGEGCLLHPRAVVEDGCILGNRVILQAGAVIGSDGFGYAWDGRQHVKIPQVGAVILHDDVEIGANSCIDRGAIEDTIVYQGVKIDNLVQLGHNVEVGACSVIVSQVGISGSTTIGQGCQLGGQVGVAGHLHIGDGSKIAAQSGVISDLDAGGVYGGTPAMPHRLWLKSIALLHRLPKLFKKLA